MEGRIALRARLAAMKRPGCRATSWCPRRLSQPASRWPAGAVRRRPGGRVAGRSYCSGGGRRRGRGTRTGRCRRARRRMRIAALHASRPGRRGARRGTGEDRPARAARVSCCGRSRPSGEPVEAAADLPELPLDVDQRWEQEVALQADRLAPPHAGVADREQHGELVVPAGQQRGSLGYEQHLQRRRPRTLRGAVEGCGRSCARGCAGGRRG